MMIRLDSLGHSAVHASNNSTSNRVGLMIMASCGNITVNGSRSLTGMEIMSARATVGGRRYQRIGIVNYERNRLPSWSDLPRGNIRPERRTSVDCSKIHPNNGHFLLRTMCR